MSSKSKLNPTNLILDDIGNIITLTSTGSNTLDLEGSASSNVSITGINNITASGNISTNTMDINSESISGVRAIFAIDSTGGVALPTTPATLQYNTTSINDSGYTLSAGEITIADIGLYEVSFCIVIKSNGTGGATRGRLQAFLELDPNTGSFSTVSGSITSNYVREQAANISSCFVFKTLPVNITVANSIIRVRFENATTNTTSLTAANESTIYVKRIRP